MIDHDAQAGLGPAPRRDGAPGALRHPGPGHGLALADPADPGPRGARHRVQDGRRGDLPAQPGAVEPRHGVGDPGRGPAAIAAHVRLRRRRLRRRRGARRAGGPRARRARAVPDAPPGGPAVGAGGGGGPHPAGAGRGPRRLRARAARGARHRGAPRTRLESALDGWIALSDGERFRADDAGVDRRREAVAPRAPLRTAHRRGRPRASWTTQLRVAGVPDAWAGGDVAAVPDLFTGGITPPSAQYALRQARRLAGNLRGLAARAVPAGRSRGATSAGSARSDATAGWRR